MTKKRKLILFLAVLAAIAVVVLAVWLAKLALSPKGDDEQQVYDRMTNPEYQKVIEFEKAEQKRTMGEIARAKQNLDEAKQANLEPAIIKELEDAVAAAENELELERERMRANMQREIWKEEHPEQAKVLDEFRAKERETMAAIDAVQVRLDAALAANAPDEETTALKAEIEALVAKLAQLRKDADRKLHNLKNKNK